MPDKSKIQGKKRHSNLRSVKLLLRMLELLSNLVYGVSSGVPVWLIFIPNAVFENDAFDNFADKIEPLDTLPPLFS